MKKTKAPKGFVHIQDIVDNRLLPLGYHHLYNGIRRGEIPHYRFGNRYYMSLQQIEEFKISSERVATHTSK